jgi:glycyl-tRNA synthetase alpha subunit
LFSAGSRTIGEIRPVNKMESTYSKKQKNLDSLRYLFQKYNKIALKNTGIKIELVAKSKMWRACWINTLEKIKKVISLAQRIMKIQNKRRYFSKKFCTVLISTTVCFFVFENRFTASNRQSDAKMKDDYNSTFGKENRLQD